MVSALILSWALGSVGAAPDAVKPPDLAAYQAAKASAGRDADAHVALALWCEAHGMAAEKSKHLARAVLLDPSNAKARGLLGYVQRDGRWMRPDEVSKAIEESPESQALFREYQERRIKARDTSDDQNKLARWCDEHGLAQQATAHYHRVVELDPGRDLAWKHLGFKKISGRWVKPEIVAAQKAENEAQAKADKFWKSKLEKLKDALAGRIKAKQAEAVEEIARIDDPRAVPMVWAVFARGDERWQRIAAQVFGQIEGAGASQALAMMAVFSPAANIRSEASQLLLERDPREFARPLAGLIQAEIKYKRKNVAGPGTQGELVVEGKDANVKRLYTPLQRPELMPGDRIGVDGSGMMTAVRPISDRYIGPIIGPGAMALPMSLSQGLPVYFTLSSGQQLIGEGSLPEGASISPRRDLMTQALQRMTASPESSRNLARVIGQPSTHSPPSPAQAFMSNLTTRPILEDDIRIPFGRMEAEARYSAVVAQQQLNGDVQRIDAHNAPICEVNQRVSAILKNVSGQDLGDDRDKWLEWAYNVEGYGFPLKVAAASRPTIVEPVPLGYQPQAAPFVTQGIVGLRLGPSCFAGGTMVRTLQGDRPIEEVRVGDQLLTQDTTTGKLDYRSVVTLFHNPPNMTYRIDLGGESVYPTGIHRFWKSGHGWIMARDVKAGDRLRTIGGMVEVVSASKDRVQPVFNLLLEGGDNYCVGGLGVLAHDNGFVDPVEHPFDGVPALTALTDLGTTSRP